MHFKSILHVRDHSKATGTAHHLLSTIAQHVNMHTGEAFGPSVERLADRLDVTPQWVRQLRARLVAEGELILRPSRGRHPNVYVIPYERCPACQGGNPQAEFRVEIIRDDSNPKVEASQADTQPESGGHETQHADRLNPQVPSSQPESEPETLTAPTRNSEEFNPKLREHFASVLERIELRKEVFKEEKEKKEVGTRNQPEIPQEKAERLSPYWCEAHGFCHGERLPDHRPGCVLELPDHPRGAWPEGEGPRVP
jgi:hypothetical protein